MKTVSIQRQLAIQEDDRSAFEDCQLFPMFIQENRMNLVTIKLDRVALMANLKRVGKIEKGQQLR